jgi:hypothetical protein
MMNELQNLETKQINSDERVLTEDGEKYYLPDG